MSLCNQGYVEAVLPYALELIRRGLHNSDACNICQGIVASLICQGDYHQAVTLGLKILQHQPAFLSMRGLLREALESLGRKDDAMSCLVGMVPHHVVREFAVDSLTVTISFHDKKPADTIYLNVAGELPVYLPPAKGGQHRNYQFMIGGAWNYSSKKLVKVSQGTVWSDPSTTAVFSSAGELLEDLSYGNSFLVASSRHLPQANRLSGKLAVLSIRYSGNYCHWMFEFVARAALLRDAYPKWEELNGILIDPTHAGFQVETLRALGIPEEKLISNQEGIYLEADELVVPSPFAHWPVFDPATCQLLRSLFLQNPKSTRDAAKYPKRIYLTRSEATYRRVLNDAEVQTWLASAGFVSVTLSQMSVAEQATMLSMAEVVVAPHGAGLTNLVFCKPGTKVLEIFPHNYSQPYYWALANQCKLIHRYLVGRPLGEYLQHKIDYDFSDLEDIVINLDDLRDSLVSLSVHFSLDADG
jgi:capsular polysaccharide biosynthesis protein